MTRWTIAFAASAILFAGSVFAQDIDLRSLQQQLADQQAQIAEQNARLNDLQAKLSAGSNGETAENILSAQKNSRITVGGLITTPVIFSKGKVESAWNGDDEDPVLDNKVSKIIDHRTTNFFVDDAKIDVKAEVGDWFEAYIRMDLHACGDPASEVAQQAYLHWKNICNSGFGVLVGRADLVFGGGDEAGLYKTGLYGGSGEGFLNDMENPFGYGNGMFVGAEGLVPSHIGYDNTRTTQITPYWESQDGKIKAELSYIQALQSREQVGLLRNTTRDGVRKYRSINDGFGSGSVRLTWKPVEGLMLSGSFINLHNNIAGNYGELDDSDHPLWMIPGVSNPFYNNDDASGFVKLGGTTRRGSKNNSATNLHIAWEPGFLSGFKIWAAWNHEWNAAFVKDLGMDLFHGGISYTFNEKLKLVGIYEYMAHKNKLSDANDGDFYKSKMWATYFAVNYDFGSGLTGEIGWRHEDIKFKDRTGWKHTKAKMDTIYALVGFEF